jgi:hypothetical protein
MMLFVLIRERNLNNAIKKGFSKMKWKRAGSKCDVCKSSTLIWETEKMRMQNFLCIHQICILPRGLWSVLLNDLLR